MTFFLEDIAAYLFEKNQGDFRSTVIVFPNRRAQLFFNDHLSHLIKKPLWAPDYYTISDFVRKLSGLQSADQLTLLFRLFRIYKDVTGSNETFDSFYYYCEMILSDFDDIDKYLVDASAIFRNIADLKSLEDYQSSLDEVQLDIIRQFWDIYLTAKDSAEKEKFELLWKKLFTIYKLFGESLKTDDIAYEGMAYRLAIENSKTNKVDVFQSKQLIFIGFNALNRCEEILFDHYKINSDALFFWDYDESYIINKLHEAGFFLRKYLTRYPQPIDFKVSLPNEKPEITTIAVPSNISQAKSLDYCLQQLKLPKILKPSQTAVILADERILPAVLYAIPTSIDKVNISMGYPLIDTPVYSLIFSLSELHLNKRLNKNQNFSFYYKDVFNVLKNGLLINLVPAEPLSAFEERCTRENIIFIDQGDIDFNIPILEKILCPPEQKGNYGKYLREIIEITAQNMTGEASESIQFAWQIELLYHVHKILTQFELQLKNSGLELQLPTIIRLLRRILSGTSVPFSGEPLVGMQIMGILETRTLDFENLIIMSMNEGKFPKSGHVPSFIPFALREGFGLPTIRHQDAIYAYYFYRLLHRTKKLIMVHNTKTDGLQKGEQSRYLLQLLYNENIKIKQLNIGYKIVPQKSGSILGSHSSEVDQKLNKYRSQEGKSALSPSAINTYLKCKLRFFFKYIEDIEEPKKVEDQIESNVFGSILHNTMANLYGSFIDVTVEKKQIEEIQKNDSVISMALNNAFGEEYFHRKDINDSDFHGRNIIIRKVMEQYINGILKYDAENGPFRIKSLERRYTWNIPINDSESNITVGGFIDRLDEKDGFLRVIDYKTGKRENSFQSIDDIFSDDRKKRKEAIMQTFLYSGMILESGIDKPVQPTLVYVREIYQPDFEIRVAHSENRKKTFISDFRTISPEFTHRLKQVISELFDPSVNFGQTADPENCKFCPYNVICNIKI